MGELFTIYEHEHEKLIPRYYLDKCWPTYLVFYMYMNMDPTKILPSPFKTLQKCYQEMLNYWIYTCNADYKPSRTFFELLTQLIWGNIIIKHINKCLIFNIYGKPLWELMYLWNHTLIRRYLQLCSQQQNFQTEYTHLLGKHILNYVMHVQCKHF